MISPIISCLKSLCLIAALAVIQEKIASAQIVYPGVNPGQAVTKLTNGCLTIENSSLRPGGWLKTKT
ncbi:MAG: hypothetical protein V4553_00510 [Bacteroidota bacterium]